MVAWDNALSTTAIKENSLKFQTINVPDGITLHVFGPMEGRRHDGTMYTQSILDEELSEVLEAHGRESCIYGNRGYNNRLYWQVPF